MPDDLPIPPAEGGEITHHEGESGAKERLVLAAIEVFGREGYDAATTRAIAAKAEANLAAIPYYFGTKKELYHAAINALLDFLEAQFLSTRKEVEARLAEGNLSRAELMALLERFFLSIVTAVTSREAGTYAPMILREHVMPGEAFEIFYARMMRPQHETATKLVARLLGLPEDSRAAILETHALFGQAFGFLGARNLLCRRLEQTGYGPVDRERIGEIVVRNLRFRFGATGISGSAN